jgi:hypothetical protein
LKALKAEGPFFRKEKIKIREKREREREGRGKNQMPSLLKEAKQMFGIINSRIYLENDGQGPVAEASIDGDSFLVVLLGDPDTDRDHAETRVIVGTVDQTQLSLDLSLGDKVDLWVLSRKEGGVVVGDTDGDVGLMDESEERGKHFESSVGAVDTESKEMTMVMGM